MNKKIWICQSVLCAETLSPSLLPCQGLSFLILIIVWTSWSCGLRMCMLTLDSLWLHELNSPPGSFVHFPGKNIGVGCCFSCVSCIGRQILYHLSHQGSPKIAECISKKWFQWAQARPSSHTKENAKLTWDVFL